MKVKNNYNECLTNLACSIRKYFDLDYNHNTLGYIDELLEKKQPKNVVVILFDGMGSKILDRVLTKNDFFIKNRLKEISTVFPATTTAATTSIRTGLNPVEHGWLGWNTYIAPIDKTITLFLNSEKGKEDVCSEFLKVKNKLVNKTIVDEINETGKYIAKELFPFGEDKYTDLDDMLSIIKSYCIDKGKKYIYAYDNEPDHTMHDFGPDSSAVKEIIKIRNEKLVNFCDELEDTIVFVVADHGHIKVDNIFLKDYPEIINMLERTTSLEQRAISFKIKDGMHKDFEEKFKSLFGKYFNLYTKKEIVDSKLFGDGVENSLFVNALGDYIAIAENSNKTLLTDGDEELFSQHAGYTDDEIYIPLIIIDKTNK